MIRNVFYLIFSLGFITFFSCHEDYSSFPASVKPLFKKGDVFYYHTDTNRIDTFVVTRFGDDFEWDNFYHAYLEDLYYEIETTNNIDTSIFNKISFKNISELGPSLQLVKNGKTTPYLFFYSYDTIYPNMTINSQQYTSVQFYSLKKLGITFRNLYFNYKYGVLSIETNGRTIYLMGKKQAK